MSTLFYDHLVKLHTLDHQLKSLELTAQQLEHLHDHIDQLIQHHVIEIILDVLHEDHHDLFIAKLENSPQDPQILEWLNTYIEDIDSIITQQIKQLEAQILQELLHLE